MARKKLGFMQLTIMVGFGLYFSWYLISFFGLFLLTSNENFATTHLGQIVFFGANALAVMGILALFRKQDAVEFGHRRIVYLISPIFGLAMPSCFALEALGVAPPALVFYVCCFLSGVSAAVGFMNWEDLSSHGFLSKGVLVHGIVFCAGGVVFLSCTLLFSIYELSLISLFLLCASTALLAFIMPRCDAVEDRPVGPVREYFKSVWHVDVIVAVVGVAFGYAFMLLFWRNNFTLLVAMGAAIVVNLLVSIALGRGKLVQFAGVVRICTAIASCALILFVCPGSLTRDVAMCATIVLWFVFRTLNGGGLTDLANRHDYSMLYCALRGKLPLNIGFFLGLALGIFVLEASSPDAATLYAPLGMLAAFILSALFLLPFGNESSLPGYKTLALVEMHDPQKNSTQLLCGRMTKRFKLSPRESEVLVYLVRGRNAKHISEKLFISESTAKTHISNIYRKVGVHSQQELLDELDEET